MARGPFRVRVVSIAFVCATLGCGDATEPGAAPRPTPCLTPRETSTEFHPPIPLDRWGTITEVSERGGFLGAETISTVQIVELYPEVVRTLQDAGYTLLGGDNEGFEAELTFTDPRGRLTTFTMRQGPCDEVIVRVLVELSKGKGG